MIKANELRIGSLVKEDVLGIVPVFQINYKTCWVTSKITIDKQISYQHYHCNYQSLNPIPLTPEILEKCGFEMGFYDGCIMNFKKGDIEIYTDYEKYYFPYKKVVHTHQLFQPTTETAAEFEYLHQLQNLYFDLTGQELEINLHTPSSIEDGTETISIKK